MNIALQTVLCLIAPIYIFIISEINNPAISRLILALIITTVNLSLVLLFLRQLPKIENSFSNKPTKSYLLLLLTTILLIGYITVMLFIGLLGVDTEIPILLMALTGGFTILVGIPALFIRVMLLGIKSTLTTSQNSSD